MESTAPHIIDGTVEQSTAVAVAKPALPDIQTMRATMQLQRARRELLVEYVKTYMDPQRHFYDPKALGMGGESKLRLNQDGARNLRGLYEVFAGEPLIDETETAGHLDVKVKIPLVNHGTGQVVAWGIGFCSTRESKYAYRWVGERYIPPGINKRELRSRTGQYGTSYRLPNDDLADQYHTVRMMARKRAEVAATMELPGVTELFATAEDADEDAQEAKEAVLNAIRAHVGAMPAKHRDAVLQKLFGIVRADIAKASMTDLERYAHALDAFTQAGIDWKSETLLEDLTTQIGEVGGKAKEELFGEHPRSSTSPAGR